MIRICFYNYGGGMLHVSRELEIDGEVDEYPLRLWMACCNTHYGLSAVLKAGYSDLLLCRYLRLTEKMVRQADSFVLL